MRNPESPKYTYRNWANSVAKIIHEREVVAYQRQQHLMIETQSWLIVETVEQYKHIEVYSNSIDVLLLRIAELAGLRLYDEGIDDKLTGYAKLKQGDRQRIMRQAFRLVVETGRVNYAENGLRHTVDAIVVKQPSRPIFIDDTCLLDPRFEAKLKRWGEPLPV
jgi:hypothetical protein